MSAKAISEATGKDILNRHLGANNANCRFATVNQDTDFGILATQHPWLLNTVRLISYTIWI